MATKAQTHSAFIQKILDKVMLAIDEVDQMNDRIWAEQLNEEISHQDFWQSRDHLDLASDDLHGAVRSLEAAQEILS